MSSPSSRYRNNGIKYFQGGNAYVTYADRDSSPLEASNTTPPHNYNAVSQLVHKEGLTPESKTGFNAGGFYRTTYLETQDLFFQHNVEQKYWLGNDSNVVSWDIDSIYIDGKYQQIISYSDAVPHSAPHWAIATAAFKTALITQHDFDTWAAAGRSNNTHIIGKKSVIALLFDKNIGYKIAVYALMSIVSLELCYERLLSDYDYASAERFKLVGFKTDAATLVYWTRLMPSGGGIYTLEFINSYTAENQKQIGATSYPVYTQTSTYSEVKDDDDNITSFTGTMATSSTLGNMIVDVFNHKDVFTIIYKRHAYNNDESYDFSSPPFNHHKTIEYTETNSFFSAMIDFDLDTISDERLIYTENTHQSLDATRGETSYGGGLLNHDEYSSKLIYANHELDFYVYKSNSVEENRAYSGSTATINITKTFFLNIKDGDNYYIADQFEESSSQSITLTTENDLIYPGNYDNYTTSYPVATGYDFRRYAAFDGKLLACCYYLDQLEAFALSARPRTLIYKTATDYEVNNYRVDYDSGNERYYQLSVTSIPQQV